MILKQIKLIDKNDKVDVVYLMIYVSVIYSVAVPLQLVVTLAFCILAIIRDDVFAKNKSNDEMFDERIKHIESEVSAIKISEAIRNGR